jgi:hypothetical protein
MRMMNESRESSMYAGAGASKTTARGFDATSLDRDRTPNSAYVLRKVGAQEDSVPR